MGGDDYLAGLPPAQASRLTRVNEPGLTALRGYLADGEAVAFLGAGVSRPLYPLWTGLIGELVSSASRRLTDERVTPSPSPPPAVAVRRVPTPTLTRPKASTVAGPPRPTLCAPGWSRPAWIQTRGLPSNGWSRPIEN